MMKLFVKCWVPCKQSPSFHPHWILSRIKRIVQHAFVTILMVVYNLVKQLTNRGTQVQGVQMFTCIILSSKYMLKLHYHKMVIYLQWKTIMSTTILNDPYFINLLWLVNLFVDDFIYYLCLKKWISLNAS
jgi:hypothetical protein